MAKRTGETPEDELLSFFSRVSRRAGGVDAFFDTEEWLAFAERAILQQTGFVTDNQLDVMIQGRSNIIQEMISKNIVPERIRQQDREIRRFRDLVTGRFTNSSDIFRLLRNIFR